MGCKQHKLEEKQEAGRRIELPSEPNSIQAGGKREKNAEHIGIDQADPHRQVSQIVVKISSEY